MAEDYEDRDVALLLPWLQSWDTMHYWARDPIDPTHGVEFRTTPEPGWIIDIQLEGTELANTSFTDVDVHAPFTNTTRTVPPDIGDRAWLTATVAECRFTARSSALQLTGAIQLFTDFARWARNGGANDGSPFVPDTQYLLLSWRHDDWLSEARARESSLVWLQRWFADTCDGEWEKNYGIRVGQLDNPGWNLKIDLTGTRWAGRTTAAHTVERDEHSWLHIKSTGRRYEAACGPLDLVWAIDSFRNWLDSDTPSRIQHL